MRSVVRKTPDLVKVTEKLIIKQICSFYNVIKSSAQNYEPHRISNFLYDLAKIFHNSEITAIISTDISTDGTLQGPNLDAMKEIASVSSAPVIASGGVGSISDLLSLVKFENSGLFGVIVGKALYENKFKISEANNVLSSERLSDFDLNSNYYA